MSSNFTARKYLEDCRKKLRNLQVLLDESQHAVDQALRERATLIRSRQRQEDTLNGYFRQRIRTIHERRYWQSLRRRAERAISVIDCRLNYLTQQLIPDLVSARDAHQNAINHTRQTISMLENLFAIIGPDSTEESSSGNSSDQGRAA